MRKLAPIGLLLICVAWSSGSGQAQSPQKPDELAQTVSDAYKEKKLADLDKKHLAAGTITVVIEHSLIEGKNGNGLMKVRRFKNLAAIDKWLNSQQREDGSPFRQTKPLLKCGKGRCAYDFDGGILHNQLYLHDLYYSSRDGRLFITKFHLLDGD
jgi:hypothetical protein